MNTGRIDRDSGVAGLADAWEADNWCAKLFWLLIVAGTFTSMSLSVAKQVLEFYHAPLITEFRLVTPNGGMEFPVVTICPHNKYHRHVMMIGVVSTKG